MTSRRLIGVIFSVLWQQLMETFDRHGSKDGMDVNAASAGCVYVAPDLTFQVDGVTLDWPHFEDGLCV